MGARNELPRATLCDCPSDRHFFNHIVYLELHHVLCGAGIACQFYSQFWIGAVEGSALSSIQTVCNVIVISYLAMNYMDSLYNTLRFINLVESA